MLCLLKNQLFFNNVPGRCSYIAEITLLSLHIKIWQRVLSLCNVILNVFTKQNFLENYQTFPQIIHE